MAAMNLVDIQSACSTKGILNVVGVVVDTLEVYRTKGSSSCVTFTIKDSEFDAPSWHGGLKIKYFNDNENFLPTVHVNDVVLLRNIRVSIYQGRPTGVASQYSKVPWAVFRPDPDPSSLPSITTGPDPFRMTPLEKQGAMALLDRVSTNEQLVQPPPTRHASAPRPRAQVVQASAAPPKSGGLPLTLIRDVKEYLLCQLLGQVVKINTFDSEKCVMYITDYTKNTSLVDYKKQGDEGDTGGSVGDEYNYLSRTKKDWPGPWGQFTMPVTLWEPHAGFAREKVKPNDLVLFTFARIKPGNSGSLEAGVHEDRRFPEKIHVRIVASDYDDRARELFDRRKEYWRIHGKPNADSKKAERRKKKGQEKPKETRTEEGQPPLSVAPRTKANPNIQARSYLVPARSIERILSGETHVNTLPGGVTYQLPFQNVCYRPIVRVVDFFPPDLRDFAVQVPNDSILVNGDDEESGSDQRHTVWEWRFCLLVEGIEPMASKQQPREQMKLFVSGAEGEHLLQLDPTDLRRYSSRLEELRERLFLLWGNLEERKKAIGSSNDQSKASPLSSQPFTCCIKEYGVPCTHPQDPDVMDVDEDPCSQPDCLGWERRFAMFGTTIHA
ncbi:hypothetical protein NUU61_004311 [Penicillium alfredii]|uniref:Protection of telomeres protein 1 n=1 Tax=Penicillium alfredii TaxID=1506179 RepID=A0A9W9KD81_9EURO|nr:uncharacterized protein NUU61_004311 [Penicillium alfredii]KAJ5102089.1 hypothetical protein NUU61_004311 [Penicillium alfredii]